MLRRNSQECKSGHSLTLRFRKGETLWLPLHMALLPVPLPTPPRPTSKGFFTIVFEALAASQMKRAERELTRYRHLLPHAGDGNEDEPFGGW